MINAIFIVLLSTSAFAEHLKLIETFDQAILQKNLIGTKFRFKISACENHTSKMKKKGISVPEGSYLMSCLFYSGGRGRFYYTTTDPEFAGTLTVTSKANGAELNCTPASKLEEGGFNDVIICKPPK